VSACGLWPSARRLYAVILDEDGQLRRPITADQSREACQSLLEWLSLSDIRTVVLSERCHTLIAQARAAHLNIELVPHPLLEAIRCAAGLTHKPPRHTAALLARCHLTPILRTHRRHDSFTEQSGPQLPLL